MQLPRVSVITVVMNDAAGLSKTISSVAAQEYGNVQYVVVDGGSSDGGLDVIERHNSVIDAWVSEPDEGIYHAMNKGLALTDGEWLVFMNAGDEFSSADALSSAAALIGNNVDVIYSDWVYRESNVRAKADITKMNVRHQSVMYRKSLHEIFGTYVVGKHVSISDFIFFLAISGRRWVYCNEPLSVCDQEGVSANPSHFYQRIATEFIFGRRGRFDSAAIILLYPIYRFLKRQVLRKR
jgi:glycosyltransferase involved in cell wall biosynthesis